MNNPLALGALVFIYLTCSFAQANETELHVSLCEASMATVFAKLQLSVSSRGERKVSYFDSRAREAQACGVSVRLRKTKRTEKVSAKIKVADLSEIDPDWYGNPGFKCETDRYGTKEDQHCSLEETRTSHGLLSQDQHRFLANKIQTCALDTTRFAEYGPVDDITWKDIAVDMDGTSLAIDFEQYDLPNGQSLLELSYRTSTTSAQETYEKIIERLQQRRVQMCADQKSKTSQILDATTPF